MAFKGKKDKKKKKKGTKKSASDREWDHEGGVSLSNEAGGDEPQAKRQRRQTQDRDERLRRSREKMHYKKEKSEGLKKMRKGIRFSDVLSSGSEEGQVTAPEEEGPEHVQFKSEKSVFERLQGFVSKSMTSNLYVPRIAPSAKALDDMRDSEEDEKAEGTPPYSDEEEAPTEDDGIEMRPLEDCFESFFRSSASVDIEDAFEGYKSIAKWAPTHEIFADLNSSLLDPKDLAASECKTLGQIPGLHRMWRAMLNEKLDDFSAKFVPYLLSYADIFFDGCDANRIKDIESSLSLHISQHIVRAR
jgi:hypothetical protein